MGWYTNSILYDTTITEGDYLLEEDLLNKTVTVPVKESIARLIEHDKINARRSDAISQQTLGALETQNRHAAEQAENTRELVEQAGIHNELLESQNIELEYQSSQLTEVNFNLLALNQNVSDLTSVLDWRLAKITDLLSGMELSLKQLVDIAKTPSQTWAAEQFDIARDAYSNGLFDEALSYIENAISGTESQTGYLLDHRYHFLKARVLFGNGYQNTHELVDFTKAEQAFLKAERYSRLGHDKAMSLCGAALSACSQRNDEIAMAHLENAKKSDSTHPETRYLLAKLHFKNGDMDEGESELRVAYDENIFYVSKSVADTETQNYEESRDKVIMQLHQDIVNDIKESVSEEIVRYGQATKALEKLDMVDDPSIQETHKELVSSALYFENLAPAKMSIYNANDFLADFDESAENIIDKNKSAISRDKQRTTAALDKQKNRVAQISETTLPDIQKKKYLKQGITNDTEKKIWYQGYWIVAGLMTWFFATNIYNFLEAVLNNGGAAPSGGTLLGLLSIFIACFATALASIIAYPTYSLFMMLFINITSSKKTSKIISKEEKIRRTADQEKESKLDSAQSVLLQQNIIKKSQSEALEIVTKALSTVH